MLTLWPRQVAPLQRRQGGKPCLNSDKQHKHTGTTGSVHEALPHADGALHQPQGLTASRVDPTWVDRLQSKPSSSPQWSSCQAHVRRLLVPGSSVARTASSIVVYGWTAVLAQDRTSSLSSAACRSKLRHEEAGTSRRVAPNSQLPCQPRRTHRRQTAWHGMLVKGGPLLSFALSLPVSSVDAKEQAPTAGPRAGRRGGEGHGTEDLLVFYLDLGGQPIHVLDPAQQVHAPGHHHTLLLVPILTVTIRRQLDGHTQQDLTPPPWPDRKASRIAQHVLATLPTSSTSDRRLSAAATPRELPLMISLQSLTWATNVSLACTCIKQDVGGPCQEDVVWSRHS